MPHSHKCYFSEMFPTLQCTLCSNIWPLICYTVYCIRDLEDSWLEEPPESLVMNFSLSLRFAHPFPIPVSHSSTPIPPLPHSFSLHVPLSPLLPLLPPIAFPLPLVFPPSLLFVVKDSAIAAL